MQRRQSLKPWRRFAFMLSDNNNFSFPSILVVLQYVLFPFMLQVTKTSNKEYYIIAGYTLVYSCVLLFIFGFNYKPWTDEEHFYFSILEFIKYPSLDTLKHYEEMSTPLPFIFYAIWGSLFGSALATLRILSLLLACATILSAFYFFRKTGLSNLTSMGMILILTLNPYFIGVSFFVYTDMLCEFFMLWTFIFLLRQNMLACCISLLLAILCRQYMVFFIPVAALYVFSQEDFKFSFKLIKTESLLLIPVIGIGLLFVFWGGASPDNKLKILYMHQAFSFHCNAFTAYMAASMVYTFPLLFLTLQEIRKRQLIFILPAALLWYYIFPVQGSQVAMESVLHIDTIGLLHKKTHRLPELAEQLVWLFLFVSSCVVYTVLVEQAFKNYRSAHFLICSSWLFFLGTMCFSYLTWEKYLLPVLPLLLLAGGIVFDNYRLKNINRIRE